MFFSILHQSISIYFNYAEKFSKKLFKKIKFFFLIKNFFLDIKLKYHEKITYKISKKYYSIHSRNFIYLFIQEINIFIFFININLFKFNIQNKQI